MKWMLPLRKRAKLGKNGKRVVAVRPTITPKLSLRKPCFNQAKQVVEEAKFAKVASNPSEIFKIAC